MFSVVPEAHWDGCGSASHSLVLVFSVVPVPQVIGSVGGGSTIGVMIESIHAMWLETLVCPVNSPNEQSNSGVTSEVKTFKIVSEITYELTPVTSPAWL